MRSNPWEAEGKYDCLYLHRRRREHPPASDATAAHMDTYTVANRGAGTVNVTEYDSYLYIDSTTTLDNATVTISSNSYNSYLPVFL